VAPNNVDPLTPQAVSGSMQPERHGLLAAETLSTLSATEQSLLLLYRVATYITFNVIDDAAMLAFGLS
jgi:hypothetical protein